MKSNALFPVVIGLSASLMASSGRAHHNFLSVFDVENPVKLIGTVTNVEWQNPHARFYIDVEDDSGNVTSWDIELASPNILMRRGWSPSSMKVGDAVTVEGFRAKDGSNTGSASEVTLNATGQRLFTVVNADRREP